MRAKVISFLLAMLLVASLVITGCTPSKATSTPPASTTQTPTSSSPTTTSPTATPVTYKAQTWQYSSPFELSFETWTGTVGPMVAEINKITGNKLNVVQHMNGSLVPVQDSAAAIKAGLADLIYWGPVDQNAFPITKMCQKIDPALSSKQDNEHWGYINSIIAWDYHFKIMSTGTGIKQLFVPGSTAYTLLSNTPVKALSDLKGMKVMAGGEGRRPFHEATGVVRVSVAYGEEYDALSKNIVSMDMTPLGYAKSSGEAEAAPYFTSSDKDGIGLYQLVAVYLGYGMPQKLWDQQTAEWKLAILKGAKAGELNGILNWNKDNVTAKADLYKDGKVKGWYQLPQSDMDWLSQQPAMANQWKNQAAALDAQGQPGTQFLNRLNELAAMKPDNIKALWEQMWNKRFAELW